MGKRKRVRRRDRFRRVKNKYEPVYKPPVFLKNRYGLKLITESGMIKTDGGYFQMYALPGDCSAEKPKELCGGLCQPGIKFGFLKGRGNEAYLFAGTQSEELEQASRGLKEAGKRVGAEALDADGLLNYFCDFLEEVSKQECHAESYLLDPLSLKPLLKFTGLKPAEGYLKTDAGVFGIMAVRRLPYRIEERLLAECGKHPAVCALYMETEPLSGGTVAETIHAEYLGIEGVQSRMKRVNPQMEAFLNEESEDAEESWDFAAFAAYFLLKAEDSGEMRERQKEFTDMAEAAGIKMERVPLAEQRDLRKMRMAVAMFGMPGLCSGRYKNIISAADVWKLVPCGRPEENREQVSGKYDIDEMRALFFDKV